MATYEANTKRPATKAKLMEEHKTEKACLVGENSRLQAEVTLAAKRHAALKGRTKSRVDDGATVRGKERVDEVRKASKGLIKQMKEGAKQAATGAKQTEEESE
eukprot:6018697-Pleurochrysis_carterae.AAC.1